MSRKKLELLFFFYWISNLHLGWCIQQSFRVIPQEMQVVAGGDVLMTCEVDNQQGRVQWTKRGFALGFVRDLPGFDRYTMPGDDESGVFNLQIVNATLDDDAEFQCQVTPGSGGKAIRHSAKLTVLLPPTSIEIVDHAPNAQITVKAGDTLRLQCLVKNAKPASAITWFRGNNPLRIDPNSPNVTENSGDNANLKSTRNTITIRPTHSDNGVQYGCKAIHPALKFQGTEMAAAVRLDVQYEPGAPEITGYTEGEIVRAGDRKTLVCRARGGNPLPEVFWYKDGLQIDKSFIKHRNYAINEYEFEVEASDNLAKYECHVMNTMTKQPKKAEIQLRVNWARSSGNAGDLDQGAEGKVKDAAGVSGHLSRRWSGSNGPTLGKNENDLLYSRVMKDVNNILETKLEEMLGPIIDSSFKELKNFLTKDLEQVLSEKLDRKIENIQNEMHKKVKMELSKDIDGAKKQV